MFDGRRYLPHHWPLSVVDVRYAVKSAELLCLLLKQQRRGSSRLRAVFGKEKRFYTVWVKSGRATTNFDVRFASAGSTGRRNTGVKSLCWGFKLQGLTWPFV